MNRLFCLLILFQLNTVFSQDYQFEWAYDFGNTFNEQASSIAIDNDDNIYMVGRFSDTIDFDLGIGLYLLSSTAFYDGYLAKYSPDGQLIWVFSIGRRVNDIVFDPLSGTIIVTGEYNGTMDFDNSAATYNLTSDSASADIFIAKYNTLGDLVWAKSLTGSTNESPALLATDSYGNIILNGAFGGSLDLNPDAGSFELIAGSYFDLFMARFDSNGSFDWGFSFNGPELGIYSIVVDYNGSIYATGEFESTVDFDPGAGIANLTSTSTSSASNIFLAKYDSLGIHQWSFSIPNGSYASAMGMTISQDSSVIITGQFAGWSDFNPGLGFDSINSTADGRSFIAKYDFDGNYIWAKNFGTHPTVNRGRCISVDSAKNIIVSGYFAPQGDFDPSSGSSMLYSHGERDVFVMVLDSAANFKWAGNMGGVDLDEPYDISISSQGDIYVLGRFKSPTADFDPGPSSHNLVLSGLFQVFLTKLSPPCFDTTYADIYVTQCDSLVAYSGNSVWYSSGVYIDTIENSLGCDSIMTVHLTILNQSSALMDTTVCIDLVSPSGNYLYTSSGIYLDTIPNFFGCDSIITIDLTILNTVPTLIDTTVCSDLISPSGNYIYSASGTYLDTVPNFMGCDSIITLQVTLVEIDSTIYLDDTVLIAQNGYDSYQWIDCVTGLPITGETFASFEPSMNGIYAVVIESNGCADTSACELFDFNGLEENTTGITVYPNPTNGQIYVSFDNANEFTAIRILNALGQEVETISILNASMIVNLPRANGIYYLQFMSSSGESITRVISKM